MDCDTLARMLLNKVRQRTAVSRSVFLLLSGCKQDVWKQMTTVTTGSCDNHLQVTLLFFPQLVSGMTASGQQKDIKC